VACPSVLFNNVTVDAWNRLKQKATAFAQSRNVSLPAVNDQGNVSHMGFSVTWVYDPNAKTLTITCTEHPFLISCGLINAQVQHGIAATGSIPGLDA
jgi:hypothetical protein